MDAASMRKFWDLRAEEDAFYFVDSRQRYGQPDRGTFWAAGEEALEWTRASLGVEVKPEEAVVEIGCGVGRVTRALAGRARQVIALDVSHRMLDLAARENAHLENVEWRLGDGRSLAPLETASADAAVSYVVLQHIPDPEVSLGYIEEVGRVLRDGGWAVLQVSNDPSIHRPRSLRARVVHSLGVLARRRPRGQDHSAWLGSSLELGDVRAAASKGGMAVETVHGEGTQYCTVLFRRGDRTTGA